MPTPSTILIVDDEKTVRTYVAAILRRETFGVIEAEDGQEALERIEERAGQIDLLISDVRMPRLDGLALARAVVQKYGKIPIIFISGYPFDIEEQRVRHPRLACAFVTKPFGRPALLEAIRKCLETPSAAASA